MLMSLAVYETRLPPIREHPTLRTAPHTLTAGRQLRGSQATIARSSMGRRYLADDNTQRQHTM